MDWRSSTLGEVVDEAGGRIATGPFGSQLHASDYIDGPGGVPVVMPKDMVGDRVDRERVKRVSPETADRLASHKLAVGDIVLARRGDVGRLATIAPGEGGWLCGTGSMRISIPTDHSVSPTWLKYALKNPEVSAWLQAQATGVTMLNLNGAIVRELPLSVPPLVIQRRASRLLSAFDECLALERQRLATLESLTKRLYINRFQRQPTLKHATRLGALADVVRGRSYRRDELSEQPAGVPFLNLKNMARDGGYRHDGLKWYTGHFKSTQRAYPGEVAVAVTDMSQERRIVGRVFRVPVFDEGFAVPSLDLCVVRPTDASLNSYIYAALRYSTFSDDMRNFANGANVLHLAAERILEAKVTMPSRKALDEFNREAEPLLSHAEAVAVRNRRLESTRELLLPRLVSGRLDISDVDLGGLLDEAAA